MTEGAVGCLALLVGRAPFVARSGDREEGMAEDDYCTTLEVE